MKCDELKDYDYDPDFPFQSRGRFYVADEVDAAIAELKAKLAEKENAELKEQYRDMDVTHPVQIRWRKFSEEKPPKYTWCLVSGKSQMGKYIVIMDFFEEDDWAENPSLDDDTLYIEYWMPMPSAPKEEK